MRVTQLALAALIAAAGAVVVPAGSVQAASACTAYAFPALYMPGSNLAIQADGSDHCPTVTAHALIVQMQVQVLNVFHPIGYAGGATGEREDIATWLSGGTPARSGCIYGNDPIRTETQAFTTGETGVRTAFSNLNVTLGCPVKDIKDLIP